MSTQGNTELTTGRASPQNILIPAPKQTLPPSNPLRKRLMQRVHTQSFAIRCLAILNAILWCVVIWVLYFPGAIGILGTVMGLYAACKYKTNFTVVYLFHFVLVILATLLMIELTDVVHADDSVIPTLIVQCITTSITILVTFCWLVNLCRMTEKETKTIRSPDWFRGRRPPSIDEPSSRSPQRLPSVEIPSTSHASPRNNKD